MNKQNQNMMVALNANEMKAINGGGFAGRVIRFIIRVLCTPYYC